MKQYVPSLGISVEFGTEAVPDDGRYYVLQQGEIIKAYRSKAAALKLYKELIAEAGGYPRQSEETITDEERRSLLIKESIDRRLDLAEEYWGAASKKHKGHRYKW